MSEPPPRIVREEREERPVQPGLLGTVTELGRAVVGGMPPGMLLLILLFGGLLWFLDSQNNQRAAAMEQRTALVADLLKACMEKEKAK